MRVFASRRIITTLLFLVAVSQPLYVQADDVESEHEPLESVLTPNVQRTLLLWLECGHCTSELLDRVARLGPSVIPQLNTALTEGPSLATLLDASRFLHKQYMNLVAYKQSHPNSFNLPSERDYVATHLSHLRVQYQIHAAKALGVIGTPSAQKSLKRASQSTASSTVKAAINDALKTTQ